MRFRNSIPVSGAFPFALALLLALGLAQTGCSDDSPSAPDASTPDAGTPGNGDGGGNMMDAAPNDGMPAPADAGVTSGAITFAGSGTPGNGDGAGVAAGFDNPVNVVVGPDGNVYVADFGNAAIRRIAPDGVVTTFTAQDGFERPFGMLITSDGTFYVETDFNDMGQISTDTGTLWRIDLATGEATVVVRNIGRPRGLAELSDGRLVLIDNPDHTVALLDLTTPTPTPEILAGAQGQTGFADATASAARFNRPQDVEVIDDVIYVTDRENHRIRKITLDGAVTTLAGTGTAGSDDGALAEATFNKPYGLASDSAGNLYVSEFDGHRIRKIDLQANTVTTIAGTGTAGFRDAEDPLLAEFFGLEGIDIDGDDMYLYAADGSQGEDAPYHRIRRIDLK
jgi:sugar lactone lactonase YvrE